MSHKLVKMLNTNCRGGIYRASNVERFPVPDDKVAWSTEFPEYDPPEYTSIQTRGKPWADLEIGDETFKPKWNQQDGDVSRESYNGNYEIASNGAPLNPVGRTGIKGRGLLGRWGPNHAADPIVTRWKRNDLGEIELNGLSRKPIIEFIGIRRKDSGDWAIPGGMVDSGEDLPTTLKREFMEEAMNSLGKDQGELEKVRESIDRLFLKGEPIYKGYVDDPRNTDNAWMETTAMNFHDDDGIMRNNFLEAGDDASSVKWMNIDKNLNLYANHAQFLKLSAQLRNAHW